MDNVKTIWDRSNVFQGLSITGLGAVIASIGKATYDYIDKLPENFTISQINVAVVLLAGWILLFRIKTAFDDHRHFAEQVHFERMLRVIGLVVAIVSWISWSVAALLVGTPDKAAWLMIITLAISTAWLGVHMTEIWSYREKRSNDIISFLLRNNWLFINMAYIICLVIYCGRLAPLIHEHTLWPLYSLYAILLIDGAVSRFISTSSAA